VDRKVNIVRFTLGNTSRAVGFWFCVWVTCRLVFDITVVVSTQVLTWYIKAAEAVQMVRDTLLAG